MFRNVMDKFLRHGKGLLLAYDQGFEHGPTDFNAKNVDPKYILDIARGSGVFTGVIFQKGVAERYYPREHPPAGEAGRSENREQDRLPLLIVKLNGKTNLNQDEEPFAPLLCTVDEAVGLGAAAVGYTVYVGSDREAEMTETFGRIVRECNQKGIPTIGWFYLRGKSISDPHDPSKLAYAARLALELGADGVKLQFELSAMHQSSRSASRRSGDLSGQIATSFATPRNDGYGFENDIKNLKWIVENAGKCKVFISGGLKASNEEMFSLAKVVKTAGCAGMAVGRNVWQRENPAEFSKKLGEIIYA